MDPLSIAASIAGLLSAAGQVGKLLGPYIDAARETPKIIVQVHSEAQSVALILTALQELSQKLGSVSLSKYARLVQLDHLIAVLTDGVLLYSELESTAASLPAIGPGNLAPSLLAKFQWTRKEAALTGLVTRLQGFKSSITLILMILQRYIPRNPGSPVRGRQADWSAKRL
jgi:cell division control protein 24